MSVRLNPYLNFRGNAREAMTFYHAILGGDLRMSTFGEYGAAQDASDKDLIMHAQLEGANGLWLMGSDVPERLPFVPGANASAVSLSGDDESRLTGYYDALARGGEVLQPLTKAQWGDSFGMVKDRFGVTWMVNIAAGER
jgi:PhnB protein